MLELGIIATIHLLYQDMKFRKKNQDERDGIILSFKFSWAGSSFDILVSIVSGLVGISGIVVAMVVVVYVVVGW